MAFIMKDQEKYSYERTGDAKSPETLVFIHGATMTGLGMAPLAAQFPEYNCITVSLPGHGESEGPTKNTVEEFSDSVFYLVEELQKSGDATDKVTLLGFSMGGCITVEISLRSPSWLKRAVVLSSGADVEGNLPLIKELNAMEEGTFRAQDLYAHLWGHYTTEEEKESGLSALMQTKADDATGHSDLKAVYLYSKQQDVKNINIPLLVVAGDDDNIVPVNISIRLRDGVADSDLLVLPYRGHSAIYEEMETVVKTVKNFFGFHPL